MPQKIARLILVLLSSLITIAVLSITYLEIKTSFSLRCKFPELTSSPLPPLLSDSNEDDTIFYKTDEFGRRVEPFDTNKKINHKLLVFGGSTAWGYGLTEDQTLSAVISKDSKETQAFNYACPACGPNDMLYMISKKNLIKELGETERLIVVYMFHPFHIERALPVEDNFALRFTQTEKNIPIYEQTSQGLRLDPNYADNHCAQVNFSIVKFFVNYHPLREEAYNQSANYKLLSLVFENSYMLLQKRFPKIEFYILFYPTPDDIFYKNLSENLSQEIKILDYERLFSSKDEQFILPKNNHPSALAIQRISNQLIHDLNL